MPQKSGWGFQSERQKQSRNRVSRNPRRQRDELARGRGPQDRQAADSRGNLVVALVHQHRRKSLRIVGTCS